MRLPLSVLADSAPHLCVFWGCVNLINDVAFTLEVAPFGFTAFGPSEQLPHLPSIIGYPQHKAGQNLAADRAFMQEMSDIRVHCFWSLQIVIFNLGDMKTSSTTLLSHQRWCRLNSLLSVLSNGCPILCWLSSAQGGAMLHCRRSFRIHVRRFRSSCM